MNKGIRKHYLISTLICLMTILIIAIFYKKLPDQVPIHFDMKGTVDRTVSKRILLFAYPIISALINSLSVLKLSANQEKRVFMYYLMPAIAVVVSVLMIVLGMR